MVRSRDRCAMRLRDGPVFWLCFCLSFSLPFSPPLALLAGLPCSAGLAFRLPWAAPAGGLVVESSFMAGLSCATSGLACTGADFCSAKGFSAAGTGFCSTTAGLTSAGLTSAGLISKDLISEGLGSEDLGSEYLGSEGLTSEDLAFVTGGCSGAAAGLCLSLSLSCATADFSSVVAGF